MHGENGQTKTNGKQVTTKDVIRFWAKQIKHVIKLGFRPRILIAFRIDDPLKKQGSFQIAYPGMTHQQAASVLAMGLEATAKKADAEQRNKIVIAR